MGTTNYPPGYLSLNRQSTKKLNVVVQIQGISTIFSLVPIYEKIRYGDPRIHYGDPGIVYGGLIAVDNVEPILMVDSGLNITQQIEPEQGRGSVATITLNFIDKNGIMTKLIAENSLVPEPLVNVLVTVSLGFTNSSFPEDYYKVFRGYITNTTSIAGMVSLELSDANIKRRQTIFLGGTTTLAGQLDNSTTFIPVVNTSSFIDYIIGPGGDFGPTPDGIAKTYDYLDPPFTRQFGTVTCYLLIDSEFMTYAPNSLGTGHPVTTNATWSSGQTHITVSNAAGLVQGMSVIESAVSGIPANTIITSILGTTVNINTTTTTTQSTPIEINFYPTIKVLSRGGSNSRGTFPDSHDIGATVTNSVQFQGNVIDLALKIMMSGFDGPWLTGVSAFALGTSLDPANPENNAILFPAGINAVSDYGLTVGDFIGISGSTAGNNGNFFITGIQDDLGDSNRMVIVNGPLSIENPASNISLSFRSQYDTLPVSCGLKNTPQDTDVTTHQQLRQLLFSSGIYRQRVFISDTQAGQGGKDLIEGTLWLPTGIYTITRYGQISIAVTLPPIAQQGMIFLDQNNIIDPDKIRMTRATNKRRFYNVVTYQYDLSDAGNYASQNIFLDETSANPIDVESILPILADGVKSDLGGAVMVQNRGLFILNRYKKAAFEITLKVNWSVASLIEVGDIVALADNGQLKISNIQTGVRDLGTQLFEVIQRQLDVKGGFAQLTLLSNIGYQIGQRYATISPSSVVTAGSTTSSIEIEDSFGALFPGNEKKKWEKLFGLPIRVHDYFYTVSATANLIGFDPADPYKMLVSPDLAFAPSAGNIVDIVPYGNNTSQSYNALYKTLYSFIDPTLTVTSGTSPTQFSVSLTDAAVLNVGLPVMIHSADYSVRSPEQVVTNVNLGTGLVTVAGTLGFTPSAGQLVELIGFKDGLGPYRIL